MNATLAASRRARRSGRTLAALLLAGLCLASRPAARAEETAPATIRVEPRSQDGPSRPEASVQTAGTLAHALDLVADLRGRDLGRAITVELAPGTLRLDAAVRIGREHGGTGRAPLVIRGAPNGASRITGSVELRPLAGGPDPELLARVPEAARAHVRAYRLPEAAVTSPRIHAPKLLSGPPRPLGLEVYDREGALVPARWPNEGWARIGGAPGQEREAAVSLDPARVARWRGEPDLWVEGYWWVNWLFESIPVTGLDAGTGRLTLDSLPFEGVRTGNRVRVAHALGELDAPGEWWRDRARGLLLAWPRDPSGTLSVAVTDTLFSIEDASHVRIEDLSLEQTRGDIVGVRGGEDIVLRRDRLAWAGGRAAVFEDTRDGGLDDCVLADIGRTAVRLQGGDRERLRGAGLFVRASEFTRYARLSRTQSPAIEVDGVGAAITGNLVHDGIDAAVRLYGNDHRVAGNEFARLLADTTDDGVVYSGRDWTARGNVIERNLFRDVRADPGSEVKGVYLDDLASGFTIRDNLFLRVDQPVFIGGGRDNLVEDNLFVAASPAISVDSRGETWDAREVRDPGSDLRKAYAAMPVGSALWRGRYPSLAEILSDAPLVGKRNRLSGNLFIESEPFRFDDGGQRAEQLIGNNTGPEGVRLRSGGDLAQLAARSSKAADFADLLAASGTLPLPFDPRRIGPALRPGSGAPSGPR